MQERWPRLGCNDDFLPARACMDLGNLARLGMLVRLY